MEKIQKKIILDEEEYVNQKEAADSVGLSVFTFRKKVEKYSIPSKKLDSGSVLYRVKDIEDAVKKGWFLKWYM